MERVKIISPENWLYKTQFTVPISYINYGNHLGNDKILTIAHEARLQWLQNINASELNVGEGIGLIMADAAIQFLGQGYHNDLIEIKVGVNSISKIGFQLIYSLVKINKEGEELGKIALVSTNMLCFNYTLNKISPIPSEFGSKIK
jgi:acyl-CoA thioester hydrolase